MYVLGMPESEIYELRDFVTPTDRTYLQSPR